MYSLRNLKHFRTNRLVKLFRHKILIFLNYENKHEL